MKAAIIIFSDPTHGGEEALGRAFNGLAAAYDFKQKKHRRRYLLSRHRHALGQPSDQSRPSALSTICRSL